MGAHKKLFTPLPAGTMSGVPDTLAAPTATALFVLFDTLLVVLEGLAATTQARAASSPQPPSSGSAERSLQRLRPQTS